MIRIENKEEVLRRDKPQLVMNCNEDTTRLFCGKLCQYWCKDWEEELSKLELKMLTKCLGMFT